VKILAIIPARGGSKRLPVNTTKLLGGWPLIVYPIYIARNTSGVCDNLVSPDGNSIASISATAGTLVPWLPPSGLTTDAAKSADTVLQALDWNKSISSGDQPLLSPS
jgi:CMP-N,N'-diacetyllegionaminic acid synthase